MDLLRTDVLSIFDLAVNTDKEADAVSARLSLQNRPTSPMAQLLDDSYDWVFYEGQHEGFTLYDISHTKRSTETVGIVVRFNQEIRIGTCIVWRKYDGHSDPLERKQRSWEDAQADVAALEQLCPEVRIERQYPFVAMELTSEDLTGVCRANSEYLGRIFTGDHEGERADVLRSYLDRDLSRRSYEVLLIRWTEALAIYRRMDNQEFYEKCFLRAAQIFEHCVLGRATMRSIEEEARSLTQRLARRLFILTPAIWMAEHRIETWFSESEQSFATSPKVQSVEADRLVSSADNEFGIQKAVLAAKAQVENVRGQVQWAKAQTLAFIGVATYVIDKIVGWDHIRNAVLRLVR
jgi:hypothetical protein